MILELYQTGRRIQRRAVRRAGELFKAFRSPGARTDQPRNGGGPRSQRDAAKAAGVSKDQELTDTGGRL